MTDREQLIELMRKGYETVPVGGFVYEGIADYLLNHGVIVLPCKVGDTVYLVGVTQVFDCTVNEINIKIIDEMSFSAILYIEYVSENYGKCHIAIDWTRTVGKTIFLTREEAEQALKERENNA